MRRTIGSGVCVALILCLAAPATRAAVQAPGNVRAVPDYGDISIVVEWDDVGAEDGYRVLRGPSTTGPFQQVGPDLPPDTLVFTDATVDIFDEYFYMVRAFDAQGESGDSNVFQQNVRTIWPNPGNPALLHNWNDTIGAAGSGGQGYHKGCDIQQTGSQQNTIVFPRGGIVARVGNQGADNNHIYTEIRVGGLLRYDSFNHLNGNNANAIGWDVGDYARAGQTIGEIGDRLFTFPGVDWVDHVHFFVPSDPITNEVDGRHPLEIFDLVEDRDPQDVRPRIFDHASDGTVLFHRQGQPPGPPYLGLPLGDDPATPEDEGDVDIHVEIADDMNGGVGTTLVPTSVSYWIAGPACDGSPAAVRDAGSPYMLLRWDDAFFLDQGVNWRDLVDEQQDLSPSISHDGVSYPTGWNNFKHFIVTNTSGAGGSAAGVDPAEHWNTDAMDDGSPPTVAHANFAGQPDAVRARDARFPDGTYTLHVAMTDLVGGRTDELGGIALENFAPAVRGGCVDTGGVSDFLRLTFSEPMDAATVQASLAFERVGSGPVPFSVTTEAGGCAFRITPDQPPDPGGSYQFLVDAGTAADLAGKLLDGIVTGNTHDGVSEGTAIDSVSASFTFAGIPELVLTVDRSPQNASELTWTGSAIAESYSISRGALSALAPGDYGACLESGLIDNAATDPELPLPGDGFFYLVQGVSPSCGATGTLGSDSGGVERVNTNPAACN
jgi:hypothetical protein